MKLSPLFTDLYQLTMAQGYWSAGKLEDEAVFHLFYRRAPFGGSAAIAAGIAQAAEFIAEFSFEESDLEYLATLTGMDGKALFDPGFLKYLSDLELAVDVEAVREGEIVYPNAPLMRVTGPLLHCQLLESALLNLVNFQTLIATKAALVCAAADGDPVLEFGMRRAQGVDGAMAASRAAYIGGCTATSNVLAGQRYGIPVRGTHAHSWVMAFESELESFFAYADAMPNNVVLLVDTYDTAEGVRRAVEVGEKLRERGYNLAGVRLDSGDLAALSTEARRILDDAGFPEARIVASNDLDEIKIRELKAAGGKVDTWGVGTKLVTAYDEPALGGVFKLAAIRFGGEGEWQPRIKLSEDAIKCSIPCSQQVWRITGKDVIAQLGEDFEGRGLLEPLIREGKRVGEALSLEEIRAYADGQKGEMGFPDGATSHSVELSPDLNAVRQKLIDQHLGKE